jgi:hypothetical protein
MSAIVGQHHPGHGAERYTGLARWITATNHKDIGTLYLWFSFAMFAIGGLMALVIRVELFSPSLHGARLAPGRHDRRSGPQREGRLRAFAGMRCDRIVRDVLLRVRAHTHALRMNLPTLLITDEDLVRLMQARSSGHCGIA